MITTPGNLCRHLLFTAAVFVSAASAFSAEKISLSDFGDNVEGLDWTWEGATSTLYGTEALGAVIFPKTAPESADLTQLPNYSGNAGNLRIELTGSVERAPAGAFLISLEDGLGNVSATPIFWSSFTTGTSTVIASVNTAVPAGFQWHNIVGWTLDSGGSGQELRAKFVNLSISSKPPTPPPPVIGGATRVSSQVGAFFTYPIPASNSPTSYKATGLPPGLGIKETTGLISGKPTTVGDFPVTVIASNGAGPGPAATLIISIKAAPPPTITASRSTLRGFSAKRGKASKPRSFSISGSNLTSQVTVRAPTGYQVSRSAARGYASSLKLSPKLGALAKTTIHVRIAANKKAKVGARNGTVTISTSGTTTRRVNLKGKVTR